MQFQVTNEGKQVRTLTDIYARNHVLQPNGRVTLELANQTAINIRRMQKRDEAQNKKSITISSVSDDGEAVLKKANEKVAPRAFQMAFRPGQSPEDILKKATARQPEIIDELADTSADTAAADADAAKLSYTTTNTPPGQRRQNK